MNHWLTWRRDEQERNHDRKVRTYEDYAALSLSGHDSDLLDIARAFIRVDLYGTARVRSAEGEEFVLQVARDDTEDEELREALIENVEQLRQELIAAIRKDLKIPDT